MPRIDVRRRNAVMLQNHRKQRGAEFFTMTSDRILRPKVCSAALCHDVEKRYDFRSLISISVVEFLPLLRHPVFARLRNDARNVFQDVQRIRAS